MKLLNKKLMLLMMGIIVMLLALLTGKVQAASQEFGLQEYRKPVGSTQYGYKVSDKYVWKIVTYSGSAINYDRTLYCLKAEQGFYTSEPGVFKETYNLSYDFMNKNSMSPLPVPSQYYNQIVWILNHSYIPSASTASTDKTTLLQNAGITGTSELTDDDIDVVQQLAIWYFTNYDDSTYHKDMVGEASFQTVLQSTKTSGGTSAYQAIEDINQTRYDQMDKLFVYLVENAKKATASSNSTSSPIAMGNTTPTVEVSGSNYIVGPFKIDKNNDTPYTINFSITDQSGKSLAGKYTLLDSNKSQTSQTLAQLVGSNFYLRIPISTVNSENITSLRFSMNGNYTITTATYWTKSGDSTVQPIVELGRTPKAFSGNKEVTFPKEGSYNLKLIKVEQGNTTNKLQGATFRITSPNGTVTETTSSNGEINVGPITINTPGTDTITIEETQAPDGYEKVITAPINVQVTKTLSSNTYTMSNAVITNTQTGSSISVSGSTITVTVENKLIPKDSEYNLKLVKVEQGNTSKKLQGAEFRINSPTGEVTQTTNASGEINIGPIAVTATGTDTITIEETKAPDGYEKIITAPITVQVTKVFENNTYKMSTAQITNAQTGASLTLSGNTITVTVENKLIPKTSEYNLKLIKVEEGTSNKLEGAEFKINSPNGEVTQTTNASGEINIGPIAVTATGTDTITIEETKAPAGYEKIITAPITVQVTKVFENNTYKMSDAVITNAQNGADISLSGNTITVTVENKAKYFDLALRKYITQVNGENVANTRVPVIDTTSLTTGTTASYKHRKDPVAVTTGDKVIYNLTIYNEGQKAGRATKIEDQLPTGLVFNRVVSGNFELDSYSETDNLLKLKRTSNTDNLDAYNGTTLDSETIQIECTVTAVPTNKEQILTNVAWISEEYDAESNVTITNEENADRDSVPGTHPDVNKDNIGNNNQEDLTDDDYYFKGQEDDDDFEKLKVVYFDLALRKFITGKNDTALTGREPQVDVTNLADGTSTTATYNHPKNPIDMQRGDIVIYTIRVYNEGSMDGYANEITDYLPEELEFLPDHEINQEYEWQVSSDGRHVTTDYLSKAKETSSRQNLLKAFDGTTLDYKDVKITCKIKDTAEVGKKLTNLAEITESKDSDGNDVVDRDSETDNVEVPTDEDLPNYKDDEIDKDYVPGQEDDDDFEKVKVVYFDLALRKFITAVDDTEITNRIPQLSIGEDGNIDYNHTKEPVEVENGNIVTYTLRIYNEGMMAGYASKVKDDVPDGLEFLPDNEINKEYRWVLSEDGKSIETDYLSKEQEQTEGANLIKAFDPELGITDTNPDYRDLKIAFRVTEPNTSDRILVNTAEISDDRDENNDPVDDIDSTPDNNNEWNEEDDLDKEFVKVKYFDLALKKWVSRAIVTNQDGSQNIIETGHTGDEDPEPPAKVDLGRQDINKVTVKFEFQIKITNEGEIAGYATEVTDYIPEGLKFIQEDNPLWYPREPLNGRERVGTTQLADTLLQPGESATISILLTWINDPNNMGLKTNIAEISQDDNDSDTPDIDSTPDNFTDGEDDIDDAPVMLTVALGDTQIYIGLGFIIVAMLTGGIWAIKRYVL